MTIYEKVAERAKERGLPIYKLEKAAGVSNATIRRWQTSDPQVESLRKVAAVLECTIDELVSDG